MQNNTLSEKVKQLEDELAKYKELYNLSLQENVEGRMAWEKNLLMWDRNNMESVDSQLPLRWEKAEIKHDKYRVEMGMNLISTETKYVLNDEDKPTVNTDDLFKELLVSIRENTKILKDISKNLDRN